MIHLLSTLSILLQVASTKASSPVRQFPILSPNTSIGAKLFDDLERCSRLADIAYCVTPPSTGITSPFECLSRCGEFPQFELVTTWNTGPLLSDSAGFVALDHEQNERGNGKVVIAFRGTYSFANAIVDLSTIPQSYTPYPGEGDGDDGGEVKSRDERAGGTEEPKCNNCSVHIGFNRAWQNTRDSIMPDILKAFLLHPRYELVLIGHSLGGAVAMLAALELQARGYEPTITTFGEPRVGNEGLAHYVNARFELNTTKHRYRRVTHIDDPIPLLPLTEWNFAMHSGEIFIGKSDLAPAIEDLKHCDGDNDMTCIAQQDNTLNPEVSEHLLDSVAIELHDIRSEPWGIPSRYKLWQLIFAHRDYFHRLGVCLPGGDPFYPDPTDIPRYS